MRKTTLPRLSTATKATATVNSTAWQRQGLKRGETALVQLGNVAEFYITFFALLRIGVAPVNALFSHQRSELNAYAAQIEPALLIADREHALFADDDFLNAFVAQHASVRVALLLNDGGERSLAAAIARPDDNFVAHPTPADEVAFFQLSGGSTGTPKLIPRTHNDYEYSIRRSNQLCGVSAETRYLNALPAAHNYAMSSPGSLGVFLAGGVVVLAHDPSATLCFPLIEKHQINLTSLVPPQHWVIANLKETQLAEVRVGQPVTFTVDALNGETFHGKVQSISPATGVEFSAISPDNATGNFVKIAQRIPVRITVNDGQNNSERLRPGMSVQVTIDTRAEKQP